MLCKVCREDLPAAKFNSKQYLHTRLYIASIRCTDCEKLSKKEKRERTDKAVAFLKWSARQPKPEHPAIKTDPLLLQRPVYVRHPGA